MGKSLLIMSKIMSDIVMESFLAYIGIDKFVDGC